MARTYDWTAPAKLFFWPAEDGSDEELVYPTLRAALRAADEGAAAQAWIITHEGDILSPKLIEDVRLEMNARRAAPLAGLFGWARAA